MNVYIQCINKTIYNQGVCKHFSKYLTHSKLYSLVVQENYFLSHITNIAEGLKEITVRGQGGLVS